MKDPFSNPNTIILLGYMGCGKSTIGKALGESLQIPFLDLDAVLESKFGMSIPDLFSKIGAANFRKVEHDALLETLDNTSPMVLSLGGGTPCYYNTMEVMHTVTSHVIYLEASAHELASRLFQEKDKRPLISHVHTIEELQLFIAKHLFERQAFYSRATHRVKVDHKSVQEIVTTLQKLH